MFLQRSWPICWFSHLVWMISHSKEFQIHWLGHSNHQHTNLDELQYRFLYECWSLFHGQGTSQKFLHRTIKWAISITYYSINLIVFDHSYQFLCHLNLSILSIFKYSNEFIISRFNQIIFKDFHLSTPPLFLAVFIYSVIAGVDFDCDSYMYSIITWQLKRNYGVQGTIY